MHFQYRNPVSSQIWSRHFWSAIFGRTKFGPAYLVGPIFGPTHIWSKTIFGQGHFWSNQIWQVPYLVQPDLVGAIFGPSKILRYLAHTQQGKHRLGQVVRLSEVLLRYLAHTQQGKHRLGQVVRLSEVLLRYLANTQQGKHRLGQVVRLSQVLLRYLAHTQRANIDQVRQLG